MKVQITFKNGNILTRDCTSILEENETLCLIRRYGVKERFFLSNIEKYTEIEK